MLFVHSFQKACSDLCVYLSVDLLAQVQEVCLQITARQGESQSKKLGPLCVVAKGKELVISTTTNWFFSVLMTAFANSGVSAQEEEQNKEIIEKTTKSNNVP